MISGLITTRHIFRHSGTILREFGVGTFLRCCAAVLTRRQTTFLALVFRLAPARRR